jgi:DNA polymerase-1
MRWLVHADDDGGGRLAPVPEAGSSPPVALGAVRAVEDLAAAVRALEAEQRPRWIWADSTRVYPELLREGVRVERCHDVVLVDEILAARE